MINRWTCFRCKQKCLFSGWYGVKVVLFKGLLRLFRAFFVNKTRFWKSF